MFDSHVLLKPTAADPHKCHPVAVSGIHVGLKLEHEAAESIPQRIHQTFAARTGDRPLGHFQKSIQKRTHPEIGHRRTEEHRRELTGVNHLKVELSSGRFQQLHFLDGQIQQLLLHRLPQLRVIQSHPLLAGLLATFGTAEQHNFLGTTINDTAELFATADRPVHGPWRQPQFGFDLIKKAEGFPPGPIHLVDEGEDRNLPHAADLEQLPGLRFKALGGVLEHHGVIGCREGSIGVFGEILVARRVEQVDRGGVVVELKHR